MSSSHTLENALSSLKYTARIFTVIVSLEILLALFVDERWRLFQRILQIFHLPAVDGYPTKWELFALLAALVLLVVYFWTVLKMRKDLGDWHFGGALAVLSLSGVTLLFAVNTLPVGGESSVNKHFGWVLAVAYLFLAGDWCIWKGLRRNVPRPSKISAAGYFLYADVPITVGLTILAIYQYFTHPWTDSAIPKDVADKFLGGAIAFQWVVSNVIVVIVTWNSALTGRKRAVP